MSSSSKNKKEKSISIRDSLAKLQTKQSKATGSSKAHSAQEPIEISDDDDSKSPDSPLIGRKLDKLALQSDTDMVSVKSGSTYASTGGKGKSVATSNNATANRKRKATVIDSDEEEEEEEDVLPRKKAAVLVKPAPSAKKPSTSVASKKAKAVTTLDDSSSDEELVPAKKPAPKKATAPRASSSTTKTTKTTKTSSAMDESASTSKPAKSNFAAVLAKRAAGPAAPGSKDIPIGQPNCLGGLALVFTGELDSLSREEASDLAKRYGARVTTAPSSKTSYVVLGKGAGPSKLAMIEKHGLKTLSEDEFLSLIRTRKGVMDEKTLEKLRKEEEKIKNDAKEMEMKEKEQKKAMAAKSGLKHEQHSLDPSAQLWTTKYAPQNLSQICGNKGNVEKIQLWLHDWPQSRKSGFKHGGKNAINGHRALLIYGSPGIGKTTTAHLCAKLEGFTPIELNASDARSKKLIENATNINNTSLDGWMSHGQVNSAGIEFTDRTVLIMDEVDGMSAGDRGGVVALKALIKKTQVPIICIANDGNSQKLKPLTGVAANIHFTKPTAAQIKSRIASICYKEKLNIPPNVIEQLITGAQSDIRQILTMLSTWKLSKGSMDFDESKQLAEANQKYTILSPFNCASKILGPYTFSKTNRETLGEKMDYYFHEPALMPLFVQENYAKQNPSRASDFMGQEYNLKVLELMCKASASISDGDMVDQMIRGSEQHWSLMPLHACLSFVRPASFVYGMSGEGYGYKDSTAFPQWLGQNSKQTKLSRQLGDIQVKMRMKVSGDKSEIRRYYIPALFPRIVQPLTDKDADTKETIKEVIGVMDGYYLNKEDWDTIVELGVGPRKDIDVLKNVPTATKTAFTRTYNASDHPIAFHKGTDVGGIKKIAAKDVPDLEEAFDIDDEVPEEEEDKPETAKSIALNDKMIKEKKAKDSGGATGKTTKAKAK